MRLIKWLFQPAYLLLAIVIVALYVNRETIFPEEVAESLEAEALVARMGEIADGLRREVEGVIAEADESESGLGRVGNAIEDDVVAQADTGTAMVDSSTVIGPTDTGEMSKPDSAAVQDEAPLPMAGQLNLSGGVAQEVTEVAAEPTEVEAEAEPTAAQTEDETVVVAAPETVMETQDEESPVVAALPEPEPEPVPELAAAFAGDGPVATQEDAPVQVEGLGTGQGMPSARPPLVVWQAARSAVWHGELQAAVEQYRELIAVQPDNYDAYGEMGNVLLAQSQVQAAADAYASAARLIYRSGNREIAMRVASIVAQLDGAQAAALQQEWVR